MNFNELELHPGILGNLQNMNFSECTPIQEKAIPHLLKGEDVFGLAQTGTGKTAAFLVPLINQHLHNPGDHLYLIMEPTRELVDQVLENLEKLIQGLGIVAVGIYGGTGYDKQKAGLKLKPTFIVATPGRLIDLFKEGLVDFHKVKGLVFDEADRMFDLGFKPDMKYILARVPRERQIVMLSATLNFDVLQTAYQFGSSPVEIDLSRDQARAENVTDAIFHVGHDDKPKYLLSILKKQNVKQAIVFTNFKNNVDRLAAFLNDNGVLGIGISSLLNQGQRNRVIEQFKSSEIPSVMVATDLAARGLDIQGVDLVINYELPLDSESYVHRIGRTGRAGNTGHAFSLVSDRDVEALQRIETYLKGKLAIGWMDEVEIMTEIKPLRDDRHSDRHRPSNASSSGAGPRRSFDRAAGGSSGGQGRPPRRDGPRHDGPRRDGHRRDGPRNDGPRREAGAGTVASSRPPSAHSRTPREHAPREGAHAPGGGGGQTRSPGGDQASPRGREHAPRGAHTSGSSGSRRDGNAAHASRHASASGGTSANRHPHDRSRGSGGPSTRPASPNGRHPQHPQRRPHASATHAANGRGHNKGHKNTTSGASANAGIGQKVKTFWKSLFSKSDQSSSK